MYWVFVLPLTIQIEGTVALLVGHWDHRPVRTTSIILTAELMLHRQQTATARLLGRVSRPGRSSTSAPWSSAFTSRMAILHVLWSAQVILDAALNLPFGLLSRTGTPFPAAVR